MKEVFVTLLWIIFVTDSVLLVLIVLLQSGRGGGLSGMLGGAGMAESALGPKSGLPKITGVMAGIFFLAAILIGIISRPRQIADHTRPRDTRTAAEQPTEPGTPPAPDTKAAPDAKAAPDTQATPEAKKGEAAKDSPAKAETPEAADAAKQSPPAPKTDEAAPAKSAPGTATTPGATP